MITSPRQLLRQFYDQALMAPELLCLNCAHTAWNRVACRCSSERRQDCALFVNDMVNRLAAQSDQPRTGGRSAPPLRP